MSMCFMTDALSAPATSSWPLSLRPTHVTRSKGTVAARASFYLYNDEKDVERLVTGLLQAKDYFKKWL